MRVREVMTGDLFTVAASEVVGEAARKMIERWVGSAVVDRGTSDPLGIITERDILELVGRGGDARAGYVADHLAPGSIRAAPEWTLERAAEAMIAGGFRHLIVLDEDRPVGIVSIKDIVGAWIKGRVRRLIGIQIREAMNRDLLNIGRDETLRHAARQMVEHGAGAAIVESLRPKAAPGIITDRDVLKMVASGQDPDEERVGDHLSPSMTFSAPDWSLKQAAEAMTSGGFQHVVVVDGSGTVGIISMLDIVRRWLD